MRPPGRNCQICRQAQLRAIAHEQLIPYQQQRKCQIRKLPYRILFQNSDSTFRRGEIECLLNHDGSLSSGRGQVIFQRGQFQVQNLSYLQFRLRESLMRRCHSKHPEGANLTLAAVVQRSFCRIVPKKNLQDLRKNLQLNCMLLPLFDSAVKYHS